MVRDGVHHARRIRQTLEMMPSTQGAVRDVVLMSWKRCLEDYGLDPEKGTPPPILTRAEFLEYYQRSQFLLNEAIQEVELLYQQLGDSELAVVLVDTDGAILHMVAAPSLQTELKGMNFCPGAVWSERHAGSNGMGTCLAIASAALIQTTDHFFADHTSLTCSAMPIFDPQGKLVGAVNVTGRTGMLPHASLTLIDMAVRMIENRLMESVCPDAVSLYFHIEQDCVNIINGGKLMVDANGRVIAANRVAAALLGFQRVADVCGRPIDSLFQQPFETLLRQSKEHFHPFPVYGGGIGNRYFAFVQYSRKRLLQIATMGGYQDGFSGLRAGRAPQTMWENSTAPTADAGLNTVSAQAGDTAFHWNATANQGQQAFLASNVDPVSPPFKSGPASTPDVDVEGRAASMSAMADVQFGDAGMKEGFEQALRVSAHQVPILLQGEVGTGKEVFARALHAQSNYADRPFVMVDCMMPGRHRADSVVSSPAGGEGIEQLSAQIRQAGHAGGVIFLEKVDELPLSLQMVLLQLLDECDALGPTKAPLVVASSTRRLADCVDNDTFRSDLYYRLSGLELFLPPLRSRSDKRALIKSILDDEGHSSYMTAKVEKLLLGFDWPGNVRQLRNVLRAMVAQANSSEKLGDAHIPAQLRQTAGRAAPNVALAEVGQRDAVAADAVTSTSSAAAGVDMDGLNYLEQSERNTLIQLLEQNRWNISGVAKQLNLSRNTLYRRLRRLQIPLRSN